MSEAPEEDEITITRRLFRRFYNLCCSKKISEAEKLLTDNPGKINLHYNNELPFRAACRAGNLKVAQWLISLEDRYGVIDIHAVNEKAYYYACINNRINILHWLFTLEETHGKIDIQKQGAYPFIHACQYEHNQVAKFIINLAPTHGKINIHESEDSAFYWACNKNNIKLAKYLLSLEPEYGQINIHSDYNKQLLSDACTNGHIEIAKLLISLGPTHGQINIHTLDYEYEYDDLQKEYAFIYACENGHYNIAEWLLTLQDTHGKIIFNDDNKFNEVCMNNNVEYAKLICQLSNRYVIRHSSSQILTYKIIDVRNIMMYPDTYKQFYIYDDNINSLRCIVCYDTGFNHIVRLCKTKENDHYYCLECVKLLKDSNGHEECILCKENQYIKIYTNQSPDNKRRSKRKRQSSQTELESKVIKIDDNDV